MPRGSRTPRKLVRCLSRASRNVCEALEQRRLLTAIVANFADAIGTGTTSVDRYAGTGGSGWFAGWSASASNGNYTSGPTVVSTAPMNGDGNPNYLAATRQNSSKSGTGAVGRNYINTGNVLTTAIHQIQFDYRFDTALTNFSNVNDKAFAFGDTTSGKTGLGSTNTWVVAALGASSGNAVAKKWAFGNGATAWTNTGVSLVSGTVYHFTIIVNPVNKTYSGTISDGTNTVTVPGLGFRSTVTSSSYVYFGSAADGSSESTAFSLDAIVISPPPPAAPTGLSATPASSSQINLAWTDNSSTETGFKIERSTDQINWSAISTSTATTYSNTPIADGTQYYYRVRATNEGGDSSNVTASAATSLAAPTNPGATAVSVSQINVNWTDNSAAETSYTIEYATNSSFSGSSTISVAANTMSKPIIGLNPGTMYCFRVRATNALGSSPNSPAFWVPTLPAAPTLSSALAASATEVNLVWTDVLGETEYTIEYADNPAFTAASVTTAAADATSKSVTGLLINNDYYFRVRAGNASGNSANSSALFVPATPSLGVVNSLGQHQIEVNWTPGDGQPDSYELEISDGVTVEPLITVAGVSNQIWPNTFNGQQMLTGQQYIVRVREVVGTQRSAWSASKSAITAPANPLIAAAAVTPTQITVNWPDVANELTYRFDMSPDNFSQATYTFLGQNATSRTVTDWNNGSVQITPGSTWYFDVLAFAQGHDVSETVFATSNLLTVTTPITVAKVSATDTSVALSWDNIVGETSYYVDRSVTSNFVSIDQTYTTEANQTTITIPGLSANTQYYFRVRSSNGAGGSVNSNVLAVTTGPMTPTALNATASSGNTGLINLTWSASTGATSYRVDRRRVGAQNWITAGTTTANSFADSGLNPGTLYEYCIFALGTNGISAASLTDQAATNATAFIDSMEYLGKPNAAPGFDSSITSGNWGTLQADGTFAQNDAAIELIADRLVTEDAHIFFIDIEKDDWRLDIRRQVFIPITITHIAGTTTATASTVWDSFGYRDGDTVVISGATGTAAGFNGEFSNIQLVSGNPKQFTFDVSASLPASVSGTIYVQRRFTEAEVQSTVTRLQQLIATIRAKADARYRQMPGIDPAATYDLQIGLAGEGILGPLNDNRLNLDWRHSPAIKQAWQAANDFLWNQGNGNCGLYGMVDFLAPGSYMESSNTDLWFRELDDQSLTEARRIAESNGSTKPVYFYTWQEYPDYGYGAQFPYGTPLPNELWRQMMATAVNQSDGMVLWGGFSNWSDVVSTNVNNWWDVTQEFFNENGQPPDVPSIISFDTSGARITWNNVPNADGYIVDRSENGGAFSIVGHVARPASGSVVNWSDPWFRVQSSALDPYQYSYRVRAYNAAGASFIDPSDPTATATTPSAITRSSSSYYHAEYADSLSGGASALWDLRPANLNLGGGYALYKSVNFREGGANQFIANIFLPSDPQYVGEIQIWIDGASASQGGQYRGSLFVRANTTYETLSASISLTTGEHDVYLVGDPSVWTGFMDWFEFRLDSPPATPTELKVEPAAGQPNSLTWKDNSADNSGFKVYRSVNGAAYECVYDYLSPDATTWSDTSQEATQGQAGLRYYVVSYNVHGQSDPSTVVNILPAPTNLQVLNDRTWTNTITVAWDDMGLTDNVNDRYVVERSVDGGDWNLAGYATGRTFLFRDSNEANGLQAGTHYNYRVAAQRNGTSSAFSAIASAWTIPPAPTITATASSPTSITVSWSDVPGELHYRIDMMGDGFAAYPQNFDPANPILPAGVTSFTFTSRGQTGAVPITPGSTWSFMVWAYSIDGDPSHVITNGQWIAVTTPI